MLFELEVVDKPGSGDFALTIACCRAQRTRRTTAAIGNNNRFGGGFVVVTPSEGSQGKAKAQGDIKRTFAYPLAFVDARLRHPMYAMGGGSRNIFRGREF